MRGGDEYGRRTLVFHVPPLGFIVFAYRTCPCSDCNLMRAQTRHWQEAESRRELVRRAWEMEDVADSVREESNRDIRDS